MVITFIIIIFLFFAQLIFTLNSNSQIRYEELADSVRNVFWLQEARVYDGVSSSVGWYAALLLIYKLFGFSLFTAKIFRLILFLVSLVCLGFLLKKYLGEKKAWLPFLIIGLSPTLLYYNTLQTPHGIDLLYFPIVLFLITQKSWIQLLGWAAAMWAWMSYPTFVFYLPALILLHLRGVKAHLVGVLAGLAAFLAPLFLALVFIKNRSLLILDPQNGGGLFRGAGNFSFDSISANLAGLFNDLFAGGNSYHFEVYLGEFSLIFPIISLVLVVGISFRAFKYNNYKYYNSSQELHEKNLFFEYKRYIILALISGLAVLVLSSLTLDPSGAPGIRRYTPVLVAFYTLLIIIWQSGILKKWGIIVLGLLLIHHLIVYPINLVHLKDPSLSREPLWFSRLDSLVETAQKEDLKLVCDGYCRVVEAYAAVAGSCAWNHLSCHQILGWDFQTNQLIPLSTELWDNYYFQH